MRSRIGRASGWGRFRESATWVESQTHWALLMGHGLKSEA